MNPRHHLDEATLVSYAAGALPEAMAIVASTHFEVCQHCRDGLDDAQAIGGLLMAQQQERGTAPLDGQRARRLRDAMCSRIREPVPALDAVDHPTAAQHAAERAIEEPLPLPLQAYFGKSFPQLRWRWIKPGIRYIKAPVAAGGTLVMLKMAPGRSLPVHNHGGNELTQILHGAYDDSLGHFASGDMADLDASTRHQPVASPGAACVCVAALDAPLEYSGWLTRKLQALVGV